MLQAFLNISTLLEKKKKKMCIHISLVSLIHYKRSFLAYQTLSTYPEVSPTHLLGYLSLPQNLSVEQKKQQNWSSDHKLQQNLRCISKKKKALLRIPLAWALKLRICPKCVHNMYNRIYARGMRAPLRVDEEEVVPQFPLAWLALPAIHDTSSSFWSR